LPNNEPTHEIESARCDMPLIGVERLHGVTHRLSKLHFGKALIELFRRDAHAFGTCRYHERKEPLKMFWIGFAIKFVKIMWRIRQLENIHEILAALWQLVTSPFWVWSDTRHSIYAA
jgi:hypothetical protein